jgi:hypothetical protein
VLLVYPVLATALLGLLAHGVQGIDLLVDLAFFRSHSPSRRVRISQSESQGNPTEISLYVVSGRAWLIVADPPIEEQGV